MLKKLVLIFSVLLFTGCSVVNTNTNYDKTVKLALSSDELTPNYTSGSFTFHLPVNARVVSSQTYSSIITKNGLEYNLNVNVAQYLIEKEIITKNSEGEYVIAQDFSSDKNISEYSGVLFETRRILFDNNYAESLETNKKNANAALETLNNSNLDPKSQEFLDLFSSLAQRYSHDDRSKNNGGKLKNLSFSEMSSEYFDVVSSLEPGTYTTNLVETETGYQIIYLENILEDEKIDINFNTVIDDNDLYYNYSDENVSVYVVNYEDFYNVIALNNFSSVSSVVTKQNIDDAIYNSLSMLKNININDEVAVKNYVDDNVKSKPEIINLNEDNKELETAIEKTYQYKFSASFSEGYDEGQDINFDEADLYRFNSRTLTDEEIQVIENQTKEE